MSEVTSAVNPLSPDDDKNSPKFGWKLMTAAVTKWQAGYAGESRLARKTRFDYNRSYALGKYDMQEFKDILDLDGQNSVVNLPYDCLPIAKPFLNRLKDRYNQRDEIIQCGAIDPFTTKKKKDTKDAEVFKLQKKEQIQQAQEQSGIQTEEYSDNDFDNESDIEVFYGLSYQAEEEIIMEDLINIVFYENDWTGVIKDRLMDDLINCGYAGTKVYIDGTGRIKIKFIKPENLITSYTEWNDFRDWQYLGEIYYMSIMEVRLKYPGKIDEQKLYELSKSLCGKYGNDQSWVQTWSPMYQTALARPYDSWRVPVVELDFKTLYNLKKTVVTNKFGKESIVEKVTNPDADVSEIVSAPYYVQYTGVYILDTEYVLEWGLSKNMVKPNQNLEEIVSQYTVYMYDNTEMSNKPLMEMIIPSIKKMTLYELQQLKIVAAAAPDGYDIDVALMSDIMLDGVNLMTPKDLYEIYKQTGIKYYKSIPDEGIEGGQRRVPIMANSVPFSGKLEGLQQLKNDELLRITNLVSNEIDAGNIRNQAITENTVQEAKKTGESTSNYIYNSFLNLMQRTAKVVQLRGWDILMYGKKFGINFYDGYRQALGTDKIEYVKVEATDDWAKTAFSTQIKTIIGDAENQFLEANIETCLNKDTITLDDAIDVRELAKTNVKYASRVLAQRIKKRAKQKQADAMALSQQNTQSAVAGAQAKTQGEMQLETLKAQNKTAEDLRQRESQLMIEEQKSLGILKANIVTSTLSIPGNTISNLPSFVFEGLPLQKAIDHANAMNYLQTMQQAAQVQGQQVQQASQPQQDPNQQEQPQPEQQEQAA